MKLGKIFWLLLLAGVALRCVALDQPLVDAHLLRQCQTAAATRDLAQAQGFALSTPIPWVGDLAQSYVLELPLYNFLTLALHVVVGDLAMCGKLVSVLLWTVSLFLLQGIWRRVLDARETVWANLLFVLAPLEVFYGQAVMPEMLVQALAFGFLLLLVRYDEAPTLTRWWACVAVGLAGLLVKAPEIAHLYLILFAFIVHRAGWRSLFRVKYIVGGIVSAAAVLAWSRYSNSINESAYAFGRAESNLAGFIGPLALRFQLRPWLMIALYLGAFVVPGPAALAVLQGARTFAARPSLLLGAWLGAVGFFYVLWFGNGATAQSYYNLPAVAPICALFGLGMRSVLGSRRPAAWPRAAAAIGALLVIGCAAPVWVYLFQQDHTILAAARWARDHTEPGAPILCQVNHRPDLAEYGANPVFYYYAERPTFIWVPNLSDSLRTEALARSRYAVITLPRPLASGLLGRLQRFRGMHEAPPISTGWLTQSGFVPAGEGPGFIALRRP